MMLAPGPRRHVVLVPNPSYPSTSTAPSSLEELTSARCMTPDVDFFELHARHQGIPSPR